MPDPAFDNSESAGSLDAELLSADDALDSCACTERMSVVSLRSAYGNFARSLAKDFSNAERFIRIVQLCRTRMSIDVIDLVGVQLRVFQRVTDRTNTGFTGGKGVVIWKASLFRL